MNGLLIDSKETVWTHDQQYRIRIMSRRADAPVMLCLHGGPGTPNFGYIRTYQQDLTAYATLVTWDQRGAGEAFSASFAFKKNLMKERMLSDIDNLVDYLRHRFHQDKIVLFGHSFGAVLGVWYALQHAEKVACLLNAGQPVTLHAERAVSREQFGDYIKRSVRTALPTLPAVIRDYRLTGCVKFLLGAKWSANTPLAKEEPDFMHTVSSLPVPLYLFMGKADILTPYEEALAWFEQLDAPHKEWYAFENSCHQPMWEEPEKFNELVKKITEHL